MFSITQNSLEIEFEFDGIKVIDTPNPTKFYKDIILDSNIYIDDKLIKKENIVYINELTKFSDHLSLTKKSFVIKKVIDYIESYPIINIDNMNIIKNKINDEIGYELLDVTDGDTTKIILLLIELLNDEFLDFEKFKIILSQVFDERKLIILDNVSFVEIEKIEKFINEHHFLFLTNDYRNHIKSKSELELIVFFDENYKYKEILDYETLITFMEKELNLEINNSYFNEFILNKSKEESAIFSAKLRKIF